MQICSLEAHLRKGRGGYVDVSKLFSTEIHENIAIETYNDHRMAMAFGPLALKADFTVNDAEVVSKSYPDFWSDLKTLGFLVQEL